ncbi:MAG: 4Fe-4S dicluster domain-containing protein [Dehalococcoidia bacterium]|nr:4Fe-4S dicluster domain-containing protein [Dehalococcoidia bacterium]
MTRRYGIVVDMQYCLGCGVCVVACKQENDLPPHTNDKPGTTGIAWNRVISVTDGVYPELTNQFFHIHCMHCENPPCVSACPENAINQQENGIVLIASGKCNACKDQSDGVKKCIPACPYAAIHFNAEKGVVQACTLCAQRVQSGLEPACVRACIGKALIFGDFNDPTSKTSKAIKEAGDRVFILKPEKKTGPSVKYIRPDGVDLNKLAGLQVIK